MLFLDKMKWLGKLTTLTYLTGSSYLGVIYIKAYFA